MARTVKARITDGVYVRGVLQKPGDIVDLTEMEYQDLRTAGRAEPAAAERAPAAVSSQTADDEKRKHK